MATTAQLTERDLDHAIKAIAAGLGKSPAEVEEMPATMEELINAIAVLAEVSGLAAKVSSHGVEAGGPRRRPRPRRPTHRPRRDHDDWLDLVVSSPTR